MGKIWNYAEICIELIFMVYTYNSSIICGKWKQNDSKFKAILDATERYTILSYIGQQTIFTKPKGWEYSSVGVWVLRM